MEVHELSFLPSLSQSSTILPDDLPLPVQRDQIPAELLRSATIENLISQNEDLMARLKVTLRRLSLLENENQRVTSENQKERLSASAASDQLMVLKEKDGLWKAKVDDLESYKASLLQKWQDLEKSHKAAISQLERHQKYQDRIRNHVKPFVQELKKYSKALEARLQEQQENADKKEAQVSDLRRQVIDVSKNSSYQVELLEKRNWESTEHYETLIHQLSEESTRLKELNTSLTEKVSRLQFFQERADQLENENIEMRRSLELNNERHLVEMDMRHEKFVAQSTELSHLKIEFKDVKDRLLEEIVIRKNLEKQVFDFRHQLDSLRYMWSAKNEENDKLRQGLSALEKLNVDLSAKLQEIRSAEAAAKA